MAMAKSTSTKMTRLPAVSATPIMKLDDALAHATPAFDPLTWLAYELHSNTCECPSDHVHVPTAAVRTLKKTVTFRITLQTYTNNIFY